MGSTAHNPPHQDIGLNEATNSLSLTEIVEDFRFAHTGICLFEAGNDGLDICFARRADSEIVLRGGESQNGISILHTYLDEAAIEPEARNVEMTVARQVLEWRDDDLSGNIPPVLLSDYIVELA